MGRTVRLNYDELRGIIHKFRDEGEDIVQLHATLRDKVRDLHKDWQGEAADDFFAEMEIVVLPAVSRLSKALFHAQDVLQKITKTIQEYDEDTKGFFNGDFTQLSPGALGGIATGVGGAVGGGSGRRRICPIPALLDHPAGNPQDRELVSERNRVLRQGEQQQAVAVEAAVRPARVCKAALVAWAAGSAQQLDGAGGGSAGGGAGGSAGGAAQAADHVYGGAGGGSGVGGGAAQTAQGGGGAGGGAAQGAGGEGAAAAGAAGVAGSAAIGGAAKAVKGKSTKNKK